MPCKLGILGCNMRILRALVLGFLLVMATPAVPQQPEPKPVVEYNIANCGGEHFTIVHTTLNAAKTKLTFGAFLKSPTEVKTDTDPLVFDYVEEKPDEDGDIQFQGTTKLEDHDLELDGYTRGNRIVAILLVDKKLGHVLYGYVGPIEKIKDDLEPAVGFCQALHAIDQNQIPPILVKWLHDGLESKSDTTSKS
jgi:hypothetical protein